MEASHLVQQPEAKWQRLISASYTERPYCTRLQFFSRVAPIVDRFRFAVRRARFLPCVIAITLSLVVAFPVHADDQQLNGEPRPQASPHQTANGKTVKQPPPPLFPKHARGMYKNGEGLVVIDATPQSPPLAIDDPGVPEKGEYEINFTDDVDINRELRQNDFLLVDANYGITPRLFGHVIPTQIKLECPWAGAKEAPKPEAAGVGGALFGLKFNFYNNEHTGLSLSLYPQVGFSVPGTNAVKKDLADPGAEFILPLLMSKEFRHFTFVANATLVEPVDSPESATGSVGVGFGRALTRHLAAMAELRAESEYDIGYNRQVFVNVGFMRRLTDNVILYANVGRSVFSEDFQHTYAGGGVKLTLHHRM
jgi:hypothetical protein